MSGRAMAGMLGRSAFRLGAALSPVRRAGAVVRGVRNASSSSGSGGFSSTNAAIFAVGLGVFGVTGYSVSAN